MSKTPEPPKQTRRTLPADLAAAGRIDQILSGLSIDDAEIVLERANRMFAKRKSLANYPDPTPPE